MNLNFHLYAVLHCVLLHLLVDYDGFGVYDHLTRQHSLHHQSSAAIYYLFDSHWKNHRKNDQLLKLKSNGNIPV